MRNIFYNEEEIEEHFKKEYKAKVVFKKNINEDLIFYVIQRQPSNRKPNWIWYAFRHKKEIDYQIFYYWRLFCPKDTHINGIKETYDLYFKYYDEDNKNKRLKERYKGDKNVIETT